MVENKSAPERKRERESLLVGRDKASPETVEYLNTLRDSITDDAAAEAVAMLHAEVNGDHPDYTRPPKREPFGHWHADLAVGQPTVTDTTTDSATVEVSLSTFDFYDTDAAVHARFIEQTDSLDGEIIETATQTVGDTATTLKFSTSSLTPDTEYAVQVVATAEVDVQTDTEYSERVTLTTDSK